MVDIQKVPRLTLQDYLETFMGAFVSQSLTRPNL